MARPLREAFPTAFVSGASGGLGRAFALMLLGEGVRVWGSSRDPAGLEGLPGFDTPAFRAVGLDLHEGGEALAAFARAEEQAGGGFALVVANAGYGVFGEFTAVEAQVWNRQVAAMLGTVLSLSHRAVRAMEARGGGTLVHISSMAAEFPLPFMSGYNVAKAGLSALSESLMIETRAGPVRVIDFRPGDYRTGFNRAMEGTGGGFGGAPGGGGGRAGSARRLGRVWRVLEANLAAAPEPDRAAADLRAALVRGRSGVVRSGGFFQTRVAPLGARLLPRVLMRAAEALYFGSS